ncbi:MAG: transcriptional repressor [Bacilli bacterium]|nr:transcriptional repressor [Bacilli bacterium]MBN2876273.1 transcriptional repressor [Bacilli bacterium]
MGNNFTKKCLELGISPSITRKKIYEYLETSRNHPTVDDIYRDLIDSLPTLSKTTVYNVLNLFLEHNLVESINTSNNEKRYEIKDEGHSHFTCKICNTIYDVPKVSTSYDSTRIPGFTIENEQVNLIGICPDCMKKI